MRLAEGGYIHVHCRQWVVSAGAEFAQSHTHASSTFLTSFLLLYHDHQLFIVATEERSKPVCVRISILPEDATDTELKDWLNSLEIPTEDRSTDSVSTITKSRSNLIQFNLVLDSETKQATATFKSLPAIFVNASEDIQIENDENPRWNDVVFDTNFLGMTVVYAPPEGTAIRAELVKPRRLIHLLY